ncbi:ankyrin repeat domain-containing protein 39-like [Ischnura elegans]|uniref:ankyrin repeat domain-containing protein 39-like n=1 Tax=Ischnura elegans TaxID=197161 RepID=UPI001ED8B745|nr:ankyrin repeat domain-containing protein 39-like [Ischnura elegans]
MTFRPKVPVYVAIKGSLHSGDCSLFGLQPAELDNIKKQFTDEDCGEVLNGISIKRPPMLVINVMSDLGYRVVSSTGDAEIVWTMQKGYLMDIGVKFVAYVCVSLPVDSLFLKFLIVIDLKMESQSNCKNCTGCCTTHTNSSLSQTLEEMDFERGIWYAAQTGDTERVQYLLDVKKVSPNMPDLSGYVALHYASRNGHVNVCKLLIKAGADVNLTTRAGQATALQRAAGAGKLSIVKLLLGKEIGFSCKADVNKRDSDGNTALHKAAQGEHQTVIELLLEESPQLLSVSNNKGLLPKDCATTEYIVKLLTL